MRYVLEHRAATLRVVLTDHDPFLDVVAFFGGRRCKAMLRYSIDMESILIEDIQGNDYFTPFHRQGIGTLLINTAIQYLRTRLPETAHVTGQISDVGDPEDPELRELCRQVRAGFWHSFGFELCPGEWGFHPIAARLSQLRLKSGGSPLGFRRLIPLTEFERVFPAADHGNPK